MSHVQMFWRKSWAGLLPILVAGMSLITLLGACCTPSAAAAPAPPQVALVANGGIVYVSTGYGIGAGAVFGRATAFQASNGARQAGAIAGRFLGASNNQLYVAQQTLFQVLQASDHSLRWQYQADTVDALAVSDETVYLASHSATAAVLALRASDGALLWQARATGIVTQMAAGEGIVSFVAGGALVTVRASDGALLWQHSSQQGWQRLLAVQSGAVYLGTDATLQAVQASDGALLWQQSISGALNAAVTLASGTVYLALKGMLWAFRTSDGALLWQQHIHTSIDGYNYALAAAGNTLYLAVGGLLQGSGCAATSAAYALQAERASDGKVLWSVGASSLS